MKDIAHGNGLSGDTVTHKDGYNCGVSGCPVPQLDLKSVVFELHKRYWRRTPPNAIEDDIERSFAYGYLQALTELELITGITFSQISQEFQEEIKEMPYIKPVPWRKNRMIESW